MAGAGAAVGGWGDRRRMGFRFVLLDVGLCLLCFLLCDVEAK